MSTMVSTRGRYALRVMVSLAEKPAGTLVPLKDIAEEQNISLKYLEGIMGALSKADLVTAVHGKGGGYSLNKRPQDYTVGSILKVTEGSISPVSCPGFDGMCLRMEDCRTFPMWKKLDRMIDDYLETITLADLMKPDAEREVSA